MAGKKWAGLDTPGARASTGRTGTLEAVKVELALREAAAEAADAANQDVGEAATMADVPMSRRPLSLPNARFGRGGGSGSGGGRMESLLTTLLSDTEMQETESSGTANSGAELAGERVRGGPLSGDSRVGSGTSATKLSSNPSEASAMWQNESSEFSASGGGGDSSGGTRRPRDVSGVSATSHASGFSDASQAMASAPAPASGSVPTSSTASASGATGVRHNRDREVSAASGISIISMDGEGSPALPRMTKGAEAVKADGHDRGGSLRNGGIDVIVDADADGDTRGDAEREVAMHSATSMGTASSWKEEEPYATDLPAQRKGYGEKNPQAVYARVRVSLRDATIENACGVLL